MSPPDKPVGQRIGLDKEATMLGKLTAAVFSLAFISPITQAPIQQPQSVPPPRALRIFVEEDFSTAQMLRRELTDWSVRIGIPIVFVEKDAQPYDLRMLLVSEVGRDSGSCSAMCMGTDCSSSASCSATVTIYFVSAVVLTPEGKLQFTDTGVGRTSRAAITPLARKLAKRLSVLPDMKVTPTK